MKAILITLFLGISILRASAFNATINITTIPADAKIYFNEQLYGTGTARLELSHASKVVMKVEREGYSSITKTFVYHGGSRFSHSFVEAYNRGENNFTITLIRDESYVSPQKAIQELEDASVKTDNANIFINCIVDKKYSTQDAWKIVNKIINNYFDDYEDSKNDIGYLKTTWQTKIIGSKKIRTRIIVKTDTENPLIYKIKIQSEYSDDINTNVKDDDKFKEWDRVLKKYSNVIPDFNQALRDGQLNR